LILVELKVTEYPCHRSLREAEQEVEFSAKWQLRINNLLNHCYKTLVFLQNRFSIQLSSDSFLEKRCVILSTSAALSTGYIEGLSNKMGLPQNS